MSIPFRAKKHSRTDERAEIESVTGEAKETDADHVTYDGVIVRYADDKAVTLLVSNGKFEGNSATRYKTSRGVGLGTTRDDFSKAYGDNVEPRQRVNG